MLVLLFADYAQINFRRKMITDDQLAVFANALGVTIFVLIVTYHYVTAHSD